MVINGSYDEARVTELVGKNLPERMRIRYWADTRDVVWVSLDGLKKRVTVRMHTPPGS